MAELFRTFSPKKVYCNMKRREAGYKPIIGRSSAFGVSGCWDLWSIHCLYKPGSCVYFGWYSLSFVKWLGCICEISFESLLSCIAVVEMVLWSLSAKDSYRLYYAMFQLHWNLKQAVLCSKAVSTRAGCFTHFCTFLQKKSVYILFFTFWFPK